MGGGAVPQQPTPPPAPPSAGETSAQAIQAQIDALPKILASQQQYGPQFSQLNLQELQQFGPQFAEEALRLQRQYAPQFAEVERGLSPELVGAQQTLTNFLNSTDNPQALQQGVASGAQDILSQLQGSQSYGQGPAFTQQQYGQTDYSGYGQGNTYGLTGNPDYLNQQAPGGLGTGTINQFLQGNDEQAYNELRPGLLEDVRSAQSLRGLGAISPLGSIDEAVQVARLKEDLRSRRLGIAQGAQGLEYGAQSQIRGLQAGRESQLAGIQSGLTSQAMGLAGQNEAQIRALQGSNFAQYTDIQAQRESQIRALQLQQQAQQAQNLFQAYGQSAGLSALQQALIDRRQNVALSTAGRVPISQFPQVQGQTGTGQLVQNVAPQSIFDYQNSLNAFNANIFGTQANLYGTNYGNVTARRGQNVSMINSGIGVLGSGAGASRSTTNTNIFS